LVILICALKNLFRHAENHSVLDTTVQIQVHAQKQDTGHVGSGNK